MSFALLANRCYPAVRNAAKLYGRSNGFVSEFLVSCRHCSQVHGICDQVCLLRSSAATNESKNTTAITICELTQ